MGVDELGLKCALIRDLDILLARDCCSSDLAQEPILASSVSY